MALTKVTNNVLADNAVTVAKIADGSITVDKVAIEFTSSSALTAAAVIPLSFSAAQVFTLTPTSNFSLNITDAVTGISKAAVVTGGGASYTLAFLVNGVSGTFNKISGDYDDTAGKKNFIQIMCVSGTEFWYSISQIA
jgi:hypothetical protein